jgi:hypothetical protein
VCVYTCGHVTKPVLLLLDGLMREERDQVGEHTSTYAECIHAYIHICTHTQVRAGGVSEGKNSRHNVRGTIHTYMHTYIYAHMHRCVP